MIEIAAGRVTRRIIENFFGGIMIHFPREAASLNANSNHIQYGDDNNSQISVIYLFVKHFRSVRCYILLPSS